MTPRGLKLLLFLHVLNDGVRTTFTVLLAFIAIDLSLSLTQVGILGGAQGTLTALLAIPAAYLAARFGGLRILVAAHLLYALSALVVGISPNFFILLPSFYLAATGFSVFHPIGFALTAKASNKTNIGANMGNFTSVGDIGRTGLPPLAILATSFIGWRMTMFLTGIVGIVIFILIYLITPHEQTKQAEKMAETRYDWLKTVFSIAKQKPLLLTVIAAMADGFASNIVTIFLPFLLLIKGATPMLLSLLIGAYFVGSLSGKVFLGRVTDTFGNVRVFIISEVIMAVLLLFLIVVSQPQFIFPILFALGMFTKGTSPVLQTIVSDTTHETHYEKVFGISEVFIGIAAAIAPIITGSFADKFGIPSIFYLAIAVVLFATFPIYGYSLIKKKQ